MERRSFLNDLEKVPKIDNRAGNKFLRIWRSVLVTFRADDGERNAGINRHRHRHRRPSILSRRIEARDRSAKKRLEDTGIICEQNCLAWLWNQWILGLFIASRIALIYEFLPGLFLFGTKESLRQRTLNRAREVRRSVLERCPME